MAEQRQLFTPWGCPVEMRNGQPCDVFGSPVEVRAVRLPLIPERGENDEGSRVDSGQRDAA